MDLINPTVAWSQLAEETVSQSSNAGLVTVTAASTEIHHINFTRLKVGAILVVSFGVALTKGATAGQTYLTLQEITVTDPWQMAFPWQHRTPLDAVGALSQFSGTFIVPVTVAPDRLGNLGLFATSSGSNSTVAIGNCVMRAWQLYK